MPHISFSTSLLPWTLMYVHVCVCTCVGVSAVCVQVPTEARRWHHTPWNWGHRSPVSFLTWCWKPNSGPLEELVLCTELKDFADGVNPYILPKGYSVLDICSINTRSR